MIAINPQIQSKQEYLDDKKKQYNRMNVPIAAAILGADIALQAVDKNVRKDSFTKTVKSCAKELTLETKKDVAKFVKFITGNEKYRKKILDIGNKKAFAAVMAIDFACNYLLLKVLNNYRAKVSANKKYGK